MRINPIKFNTSYSFKPSFRAKENNQDSPNFDKMPDVTIPYEFYAKIKDAALAKHPASKEALQYRAILDSAMKSGDINALIEIKAKTVLLGMEYASDKTKDDKIPQRLKSSVLDVFHNREEALLLFLNNAVNASFPLISKLEAALRALDSSKALTCEEQTIKAKIEAELKQQNAQKELLREYLLKNYRAQLQDFSQQ